MDKIAEGTATGCTNDRKHHKLILIRTHLVSRVNPVYVFRESPETKMSGLKNQRNPFAIWHDLNSIGNAGVTQRRRDHL